MKIILISSQRTLSFYLPQLKKLLAGLLDALDVSYDEIAIYLVSKKKICKLHKDFFNDPSPTDCISFPLDESRSKTADYAILGEIFVCPEVALDYAQKHHKDPHDELLLYIIHGLLHLLGYDDLEEKPRREMRKAEKKCLKIAAMLDPHHSWKK